MTPSPASLEKAREIHSKWFGDCHPDHYELCTACADALNMRVALALDQARAQAVEAIKWNLNFIVEAAVECERTFNSNNEARTILSHAEDALRALAQKEKP